MTLRPLRGRLWQGRCGMVWTLPASIVGGYVLGYGLDRAFSTHFLSIVFLILGVVAGIMKLIQELNRSQ